MRNHRQTTVTRVLILVAVSLFRYEAEPAKAISQASEAGPGNLSILERLTQIGVANHCFFTIEVPLIIADSKDHLRDGMKNSLETESVSKAFEKKGLVEELEQLRSSVPNFTYQIDSANPRIVHIIDSRLYRHEDYPLERVIPNIDFTGALCELPAFIGKQGIPISPPIARAIGDSPDCLTVVHVEGQGLKVRDALSNFIPLERKSVIIWIARTKLGEQGPSYIFL